MTHLAGNTDELYVAPSLAASSEAAIREHDVDHRVLTLLQYWKGMSRTGRLPRRTDIDPLSLGPTLTHVWLMDVTDTDGRLQFRYRLLGSAMQAMFPRLKRGQSFADIFGEGAGSTSERQFMAAALTGEPQWRRGPSLFNDHRRETRVERIILPLADDGDTVDAFLALSVRLLADDRAAPEPPDPYVAGRGTPFGGSGPASC